MPYINVKTNTQIPKETEAHLKEKLGKAAGAIGKSENYLMIGFEGERRLYFQGNNDQPIAFVEVALFGKANAEGYNKMTAAVTDALAQELSIAADHVYVKYEECEHWGWNGANF